MYYYGFLFGGFDAQLLVFLMLCLIAVQDFPSPVFWLSQLPHLGLVSPFSSYLHLWLMLLRLSYFESAHCYGVLFAGFDAQLPDYLRLQQPFLLQLPGEKEAVLYSKEPCSLCKIFHCCKIRKSSTHYHTAGPND